MTHPRGIHSSCPEGPSTINVTQNIVTLDGEKTVWAEDQFRGDEVLNRKITLRKTPYSPAAVHLYLNSGAQRAGVDYTVLGNVVSFTFDPDPADSIYVKYVHVSGGLVSLADSGVSVGTLVGFGSGTPPFGWFKMDGVQKVYSEYHTQLFSFLDENTHLTVEESDGPGTSSDGNQYYTLKNIVSSYFDGTQLLAGTTIIKQ